MELKVPLDFLNSRIIPFFYSILGYSLPINLYEWAAPSWFCFLKSFIQKPGVVAHTCNQRKRKKQKDWELEATLGYVARPSIPSKIQLYAIISYFIIYFSHLRWHDSWCISFNMRFNVLFHFILLNFLVSKWTTIDYFVVIEN
jgi:hypothetical protein